MSEGLVKEFHRRKGKSVNRSGPFSEPPALGVVHTGFAHLQVQIPFHPKQEIKTIAKENKKAHMFSLYVTVVALSAPISINRGMDVDSSFLGVCS